MKVDRYLGTTKEQRKMARAVAKDVLASLKIYRITNGVYFDGPQELIGKDIKTAPVCDLKQCEVCAPCS